jgi:membrane protein DedA with SNARE-associated domain
MNPILAVLSESSSFDYSSATTSGANVTMSGWSLLNELGPVWAPVYVGACIIIPAALIITAALIVWAVRRKKKE